jgi:hypothetical protein
LRGDLPCVVEQCLRVVNKIDRILSIKVGRAL